MSSGDFDDILIALRTSKWNLFHFCYFGFLGFTLPCLILNGVFMTPSMDHTCRDNITEDMIKIDECSFAIVTNSSDTYTKACTNWDYKSEYFPASMTQEFDLVCDKAYIRPSFTTLYMFGCLVGAPIHGFFSDKYGRRKCIFAGMMILLSTSIISTFVTNISVILVLRFIAGFSQPILIGSGYILCLEICEPKYRTIAGVVLGLPWAVGTVWYGALGYLVRDWRWLTRISIIPIIVALLSFGLVTESPRWLIVNGHFKRAMIILKKAARWNNSQLPPEEEILKSMREIQRSSLALMESTTNMQKQKGLILRLLNKAVVLLKTRQIRKITVLTCFSFFSAATVYYGLSINAANFNLDPYMYMAVSGLTEMPACSLTTPIIAKFGRVRPTVISYISCGLVILFLAFIPGDSKTIVTILAMLGKFSISSAFVFIYIMAAEAFPTECRLQGIGASQLFSGIGSSVAPTLTDSVVSKIPWVPSVIFGCLSLVAGVASYFIPETLNQHLPETIAMLEENARNKRIRKSKPEEAEFLKGLN